MGECDCYCHLKHNGSPVQGAVIEAVDLKTGASKGELTTDSDGKTKFERMMENMGYEFMHKSGSWVISSHAAIAYNQNTTAKSEADPMYKDVLNGAGSFRVRVNYGGRYIRIQSTFGGKDPSYVTVNEKDSVANTYVYLHVPPGTYRIAVEGGSPRTRTIANNQVVSEIFNVSAK